MYILYIIIALNVVIYFLSSHVQYFSIIFGLNDLFLSQKYYWQIFSTMFIHANLTHLSMNMIVLFQFGTLLIRLKGWINFTILYLLGGILTSIGTFLFIYFFTASHNVVGASGAICVLMGYIAYYDRSITKGLILAIVVMSIVPLLFGENIAWYGHFIGFAIGYFVGFLKK